MRPPPPYSRSLSSAHQVNASGALRFASRAHQLLCDLPPSNKVSLIKPRRRDRLPSPPAESIGTLMSTACRIAAHSKEPPPACTSQHQLCRESGATTILAARSMESFGEPRSSGSHSWNADAQPTGSSLGSPSSKASSGSSGACNKLLLAG